MVPLEVTLERRELASLSTGVGFIIHNPNFGICAKRAFPLPPFTNNEAELEGLVEGLKMSLQLKISNIIIEGDSQIILNTLHH